MGTSHPGQVGGGSTRSYTIDEDDKSDHGCFIRSI